MRASLVLTATLALALLAVPGALAERAYSDPAGDAGAAPDITAVRVSHDAAGIVSLAVTTNAVTLPAEATFWGYIDTDGSASSGFPARGLGAEHLFIADEDGGVIFHVMGNSIAIDFSSGFSASFANGVLTARFDRSELGSGESFTFAVEAELSDANDETVAFDLAPDGAPFYTYSFAPLALTLGPVAATPKAPVAGKPLTLTSPVTRSDGEAFAGGSVRCSARIGSAAIRAASRVANGAARCSLRVPANARGKQLRGSITVSADGAAPVTRPFALRIR